MRPFDTIEFDITSTKKQIEKLEKEKQQAQYKTVSDVVGAGVRVFIWLIFFYPFSLIAAIKFMEGELNVLAARRFAIFSGIPFFALVIELFTNLYSKTPPYLSVISTLSKFLPEIAPTDPLDSSVRIVLVILDALVLLPIMAVFVGSLSKFRSERKKRDNILKKQTELTEQINYCQSSLDGLKAELKSTKKDAENMLKNEIVKDNPDLTVMEQLSSIGLESAQKWLDAKIKNDNEIKGKQIYEEEIKKQQPDIKKIKEAADLGYVEACMHYGESLILDTDGYTKEEIRGLFNRAKEYFKKVANKNIPIGHFYYLYARIKSEALTLDQWKELLRDFRPLKNLVEADDKKKELYDDGMEILVYTIDSWKETTKNQPPNNYDTTPIKRNQPFNAKAYLSSLGLTWYSSDGVWKIKNDTNLTQAQKDEALRYYTTWYD